MSLKIDCKSHLENEKNILNEEFPKYESITKELFLKIYSFIDNDFIGVSENKIYRYLLETLKDVVCFAFESDVSKKYMRTFFKKLNNEKTMAYFISLMKTKSTDIKNIMNRFVNLFVYWQDSDNTKDNKLNEILKLIDCWM